MRKLLMLLVIKVIVILCHYKPGPKPTEQRRLILIGFECDETLCSGSL